MSEFRFVPGLYLIEVFARVHGTKPHQRLFSQELEVTERLAEALKDGSCGLYFDWGPDSARYHAHIDRRGGQARMIQTSN